jgi:hypothetical protein
MKSVPKPIDDGTQGWVSRIRRLVFVAALAGVGFGCSSPVSPSTPPPTDTADEAWPTCLVEGAFGIASCSTMDHCAPGALGARIACCDCDPFYCGEQPIEDCGWGELPEPFPSDAGPELSWSTSLVGEWGTFWVGPDPEGLLLVRDQRMLDVTPVDCPREGNTFRCATPFAAGGRTYTFFEVQLNDTNGDGVVDGGELREHSSANGPMTTGEIVGATVALLPDTSGTPGAFYALPILPTDPVIVTLTEPVTADSVPETLAGVGPTEVRLRGQDVVTGLRSLGVANWGSPLALEGLVDLAGNPVAVTPGVVASDPGSANANLGFELDSGWGTRRFVLQSDLAGQGLSPSEGAFAALVEYGGSLVGELSIPAEATSLSFDWGRVDRWGLATARVLVVEADATRTPLWTHTDPPPMQGDTADPRPFETVSVDVTPWAGQTVFLRFEVENEPWSGWFEPELEWWRSLPPVENKARVALDNLRFEVPP